VFGNMNGKRKSLPGKEEASMQWDAELEVMNDPFLRREYLYYFHGVLE